MTKQNNIIKRLLHKIKAVAALQAFSSTAFIMGVLIAITQTITFLFIDNEKADYKAKIEELNNISKSLENLSKYIEDQKKAIEDYENAVNHLKKEKSELEPLVESNRQLVENLFIEHDKRISKNIWTERIISFILGVLSSIIATIFYDFFKKRQIKKTQELKSD